MARMRRVSLGFRMELLLVYVPVTKTGGGELTVGEFDEVAKCQIGKLHGHFKHMRCVSVQPCRNERGERMARMCYLGLVPEGEGKP